jgi:hypothetical protein
VSFAAIALCVASQRIIPKVSVYFVIDSARKLGYTLVFSFLSVRDEVSHPYKTSGKIIALYILVLTFLDERR